MANNKYKVKILTMNQRIINAIILLVVLCGTLISCRNRLEEKGFAVTPENIDDENRNDGISKDSVTFPTRPSGILLTGIPNYRLATIYKVNFRRDSTTFIGSNDFHYNYEDLGYGNFWHGNYLPGLESVYGYNLVNVSHFNIETQQQKNFFEKPVLIKTLYYPSFSKDTLNYQPVQRNYFIVSAYDEDTNKDGFINVKDLRRLYSFDINAENRKALVPTDYSVYKSEYDPTNDLVYIFAKHDENKNGQLDELEPINVFWVDLKNPDRTGRQY
jgi:hypothetical protein